MPRTKKEVNDRDQTKKQEKLFINKWLRSFNIGRGSSSSSDIKDPFQPVSTDYDINPDDFIDSLNKWIAILKSQFLFAKEPIMNVFNLATGKVDNNSSDRLNFLAKKHGYLDNFQLMVEDQSYSGNAPILLDLTKTDSEPILFNPTSARVVSDKYFDNETISGFATYYVSQGSITFIKTVTFENKKTLSVEIKDSIGNNSLSQFNKAFNQNNVAKKKNNFTFIPLWNFPNQATKSGLGKADKDLTTQEDIQIKTIFSRSHWELLWNKTIFFNTEPFITSAGETKDTVADNFAKKILKGMASFKQQPFASGDGKQSSSVPFNVFTPTTLFAELNKELIFYIGMKFDKAGIKGSANEKGIVQKSIFEVMQSRSIELIWTQQKVNKLQSQIEQVLKRVIQLDRRNFTYPDEVDVRIILKPFLVQSEEVRNQNLYDLEDHGILSKIDVASDILNINNATATAKLENNKKVNEQFIKSTTDETIKNVSEE